MGGRGEVGCPGNQILLLPTRTHQTAPMLLLADHGWWDLMPGLTLSLTLSPHPQPSTLSPAFPPGLAGKRSCDSGPNLLTYLLHIPLAWLQPAPASGTSPGLAGL